MNHVRLSLTYLLVSCLSVATVLAQGKITPRDILQKEMPRKSRAVNIEKARAKVMAGYSKMLQQVAKVEAEVEKHNRGADSAMARELKAAKAAADENHKTFTSRDRKKIEGKYVASFASAYKDVLYYQLQQAVIEWGCEPDIDEISPFSIDPGGWLQLRGTCFGPSQGKVFLEIRQSQIVELEVLSWTETLIQAQLNPIIGEVPLRPYYGKVWLQTGDGVTSNEWPMMYYPIYSVYIATWIERIFGGPFGNHEDGVFLKNRNLGDGDFKIEWVERHHWGDGWSELRSPTGGGQSMGQGYHIGVAAWGHANMELLYRAVGPKGIDPPYFWELGPWGYLGDY